MRASRKRRGGLAPDRYLSEAQERRLLRHVRRRADAARVRGRTRPVVDEFLVILLLRSGLRASEAAALRMSDLPLKHGKSLIWVRAGKGGVERTVHVGPRLVRTIRQFARTYRRGAGPDEALLVNERGASYAYGSVYRKIRRLGREAGIGNLTPHMLRHTYATRLYGLDHDLRFVQDQLGHASPRTTAVYAKTDPKARAAMLSRLENEDGNRA